MVFVWKLMWHFIVSKWHSFIAMLYISKFNFLSQIVISLKKVQYYNFSTRRVGRSDWNDVDGGENWTKPNNRNQNQQLNMTTQYPILLTTTKNGQYRDGLSPCYLGRYQCIIFALFFIYISACFSGRFHVHAVIECTLSIYNTVNKNIIMLLICVQYTGKH